MPALRRRRRGGCRRACHLGVCGLAIPTKGRFVHRNILTFLPPFPKGKRLLALRRTSVPLSFSSSPSAQRAEAEPAQGLPGQALSPLEGLGRPLRPQAASAIGGEGFSEEDQYISLKTPSLLTNRLFARPVRSAWSLVEIFWCFSAFTKGKGT